MRRYGFGVLRAERALHSATDAVTLVVEGTIRPFAAGKMNEMHLHDLPWPTDVLAELGAVAVKLRVTLSYFVEPNPGRRGWRKRHRYQSHGLRFEVKRPGEMRGDFRKRIHITTSEGDGQGEQGSKELLVWKGWVAPFEEAEDDVEHVGAGLVESGTGGAGERLVCRKWISRLARVRSRSRVRTLSRAEAKDASTD